MFTRKRKLVILIMTLCFIKIPLLFSYGEMLGLPPRPTDAQTGSEFVAVITDMSREAREEAVFTQIMQGNVPAFMRNLVPVTVTESIGGTDRTAVYHATPDYFAIGTNTDYFLCPMTPLLGQRIADELDCILPTRKMSDDIWKNATVQLAPKPIPPSPEMTTVPVFSQHNQLVWDQRSAVIEDHPLGALVAGDKKDVVITNRLQTQPGRVAIYGWHYQSGDPIQPLSLVHGETYADYSHGIRLVKKAMTVDGVDKDITVVLDDDDLHVLVSDEGKIPIPRYDIPEPTPTPTPTPVGGNLVKNGSFEEGFSGGTGNYWNSWQASGSNQIAFGRASINKYDGSYSQYWARSDTDIFTGGVYQRINVTPGKKYVLRAWLKTQSAMDGSIMAFGFDLTGGTQGMSANISYTDMGDATLNEWTPYEAEFTASGDYVTIFSKAGHSGTSGGSNSYFYIDAVYMYATGSSSSEGNSFVVSKSSEKIPVHTPAVLEEKDIPPWPEGFKTNEIFHETTREFIFEPDVRIVINAPAPDRFDKELATQIIFYALPNGNSIEWTIGREVKEGMDWHYGIQHIGAQTRRLREVLDDRNIVVAYLEAGGKSWPSWRKKHADSKKLVSRIVKSVQDLFPGSNWVVLSGHSGGGAFIFEYINAFDEIPDDIRRIAFLDANYSWSEKKGHDDKIVRWMKKDKSHVFCVICYDDRNITFKGKKIVGPTGGTWRRTLEIVDRMKKDFELNETGKNSIIRYKNPEDRIDIFLHTNPENKILHTVLVEINGFIHAMTTGTKWEDKAAEFAGPIAYKKWIAQ